MFILLHLQVFTPCKHCLRVCVCVCVTYQGLELKTRELNERAGTDEGADDDLKTRVEAEGADDVLIKDEKADNLKVSANTCMCT